MAESFEFTEAWRPGPAHLELPASVDVWRCTLAREPAEVDRLARLLDAAEHLRAARFVFPRDQARFVVGRGLLRLILSRYLDDRSPDELVFTCGPHGKPELEATASGEDAPAFNLSHTDDMLVLAVARGRRVGIDVERVKDDDESHLKMAGIAERFFSVEERLALAALPPPLQGRALVACWTRKEAFVKALGGGLSLPLDAFDVTVHPDEAPRLLAHRLSQPDASSWSLHAVPVGPRFSATLAVAPGLDHRDVIRLWLC